VKRKHERREFGFCGKREKTTTKTEVRKENGLPTNGKREYNAGQGGGEKEKKPKLARKEGKDLAEEKQ